MNLLQQAPGKLCTYQSLPNARESLIWKCAKAHIYHRTRFFLYLPYKKILSFCVLSQSMSHYIDFVFLSTVKYFV